MTDTINMKIPVGVLELGRFASKEGGRENLARIRIEIAANRDDPKLRRFTAIATDGHRLVRYSWLAATGDVFQVDAKDKAAHLDADRVASLVKGTAKRDRSCGFSLSTDSDGVLTLANIDGMRIGVGANEEQVFPDWRQVIPAPSTEAGRLGVSATYFGDFGRYLKSVGASDCVAVLSYGGADGLSPVLLEAADIKALEALRVSYVVMPMRVEAENFQRHEATRIYRPLKAA